MSKETITRGHPILGPVIFFLLAVGGLVTGKHYLVPLIGLLANIFELDQFDEFFLCIIIAIVMLIPTLILSRESKKPPKIWNNILFSVSIFCLISFLVAGLAIAVVK